MTNVYAQLRVSCGLSATVNSLQPEIIKASPTQSFALWLDIQWLKLTHNEDPSDPLVQLAGNTREFQWVIVLDYILLRKIRSSMLLCQGINAGQLVLEVEFADLNWGVLKPAFSRILGKLNVMKDDWSLWHYQGEFENIEESLSTPEGQKNAVALVQAIKLFAEIYQSNISSGPEGEWKNIFMNMVGFPETLTNAHVAFHIDHYKTDFELGVLLSTLGFELDTTFGRSYPKSIQPNSVVLINRPEHWVCEDSRARGVVLDSLTQATDVVHGMDSFYYFAPIKNLREFQKSLKGLENIFPNVEVYIETEDLTEFPELELPETDNPLATAQQYHHSAEDAWGKQEYRQALLDKRIEVNLLAKGAINLNYYQNLMQFTEWCMIQDKTITAQENFAHLLEIESQIQDISDLLKAKRGQLEADFYLKQDKPQFAANSLAQALEFFEKSGNISDAYRVAEKLSVAYAKAKKNEDALKILGKVLSLAQQSAATPLPADYDGPKKYWPAILKGIERKIAYLKGITPQNLNEPSVERVL